MPDMDVERMTRILNRSVVRTSFLDKPTYSGVIKLYLYQTDFTMTNGVSGKSGVFQITEEKPGKIKAFKSPLRAYVLGYSENKITRMYLGAAANFCFTVSMNSCTFGIGSVTDKGVLVTHANSKGRVLGQGTDLNQEQRQAQMTNIAHGPGVSMIEPGAYHRDDYGMGIKQHMSTVGMLSGGTWRFFMHKYTINNAAKTCTLLSSNRFEGGIL